MISYEILEDAIKNPKLVLFKNVFAEVPSWEQFLNHTHYQFYKEAPPPKYEVNPKDKIINGVNIRENFYLMVAFATYDFFPQLKPVTEELNKYLNSRSNNAFTLMNFVGNEEPINIHSDPRHSFYWQCHGSVIWESYKDPRDTDPVESFTVEKGDIVFVPNGVMHTVKTPEPRAAISICYPM